MVALSIVATILIVLVLGALTNDIPHAYRQRRCMGRQWRARFTVFMRLTTQTSLLPSEWISTDIRICCSKAAMSRCKSS